MKQQILCILIFFVSCTNAAKSYLLDLKSKGVKKQLAINPVLDKKYSKGYILVAPMMGVGDIGLYNKKGYFEKIWSTKKRIFYAELIGKNKLLVVHDIPLPLQYTTGLIVIYNVGGGGGVSIEASYKGEFLHHDIAIKNPSRVYASSKIIKNIEYKQKKLKIVDDSIVEIDLYSSKIVKRFWLSEIFPLPDNLLKYERRHKGAINLFHTNSIDYIKENPFNGNPAVLITMRNYEKGTIALIDLKTNELLWRSPKGFFLYPHDGKFTKDKTITVFDNGDYKRQKSRVFEMDIKTNTILWEYDPLKSRTVVKGWELGVSKNIMSNWEGLKYFSPYMSGVQKIEEKGKEHYLIVSGIQGKILEVTKKHDAVWVHPSVASVFRSSTGELAQMLFKARQYSEEEFLKWKGFKK